MRILSNKALIVLFILLGNVIVIKAQVAKYSNEFLSVGVGARALSMANANVASVNDVTAEYGTPQVRSNKAIYK